VNNGVNLVQVGCGHWGKNLARNFAKLGVLRGVVDNAASIASEIAAINDVPVIEFQDALDDARINAMAIASPAATHADMAERALNAGKHVFVEKPLALDPNAARRLIDVAQRRGRFLMVGHLLQYHPIFAAMRSLVASGRLGMLRYAYSNRLSMGKLRSEENVMWSFAPHDISMILSLAGAASPEAVTCEGAAFVEAGLADWAICHMQFQSGLRAHVHTSWVHPYKEQRLVVVGDNGIAVFEDSLADWEKRLALYPPPIDRSGPVAVARAGSPEYIDVEPAEPLREECKHFIECVTSGRPPLTDGLEGLRVLEVLSRAEHALERSLKGSRAP
jgi:UDP-2-acetamido-3-amino-2,3-dideoxy-glucuronate N-acetyltransferase